MLRGVLVFVIVLLDLTPLDTPSRHRGPGRYLRELALGLGELAGNEMGDLRVLGLTSLGLDGSYQVTDDPRSFQGSPDRRSPTAKDHYHWAYARRLGLFRALKAIGADAVHLGDPNATANFVGPRCKVIVTCHDAIPARYPSKYFGVLDGGPAIGLAIERRRYRRADLVVAISDATRDDARSYLRVPDDRMVRIYNGVDVSGWARPPAVSSEEVLAKHGLSGRAFFLYVGASDWHKNIDGMLAGFARARAQESEMVLAWAGKLRPDHAAQVDDLAAGLGIGNAVRRLGFVDDAELGVLYRAARAHVLLSWCEGFGLTVVEAMACGCPVLTTRGGSLGEVVGDAALTVDPADPIGIGEALVRLAREVALRSDLSRRGQERAPRFSRAVQAREMARAYRTLLGV